MSVESLNESVLKMNYVYEDLWQRGEVLPLTLDSRRLREALFNNVISILQQISNPNFE